MLFAMAAQAQTTEFKGVPFGASEAQFRATLPKFHCAAPKAPTSGDRICIAIDDDKIEFGGAIAEGITANFLRDQLVVVVVTVRRNALNTVLLALESKFGKPRENRIGSSFDWRAKDGIRITAKRSIDGTVFMYNEAAFKELMERTGAAAAKTL